MTAKADGAEVSQRLSKIETAISRRKTIEFTYYTIERDSRGEAEGRPVPPGLPGRAVLSDRPLARARRDPRLPPLPDPGQGLLRLQGRARLLAARGLRAPRLRAQGRVAARRDPGHGEDLPQGADRLAGRARLRRLRRVSRTRAAATAPRARAGSSRPSTPPAARWSPGCCTGARTPRCSIRPSSPRRSPSASSCSASATRATSSLPTRFGPCRRRRARRAPTAARSPRSARSASPAW